ncbi:hypothetical protein TBLA_0G03330 [Henningerozyma blattae CBS 6284]|uniref:Sm protein G n=1 Tax=Henningerozyma blattae (strain ATCC 34711 / CBS 6284 / DSM 70876 / NBRC 10599 / NRRL Y-10934 / UCD 77-7) TaxID=1071380 RepID=I2H7B8_HENB6|nr:hypothetical protein TBLA_0G03330 [Tetrapisispora blattae CBS 6284]CCH62270.1 hypothetical protein TBLA_0G03330 [Tetrapisispora blattae CBS 6284]
MVSTPELKKYVNRKILLKLNNNRTVIGELRGYDIFLNVVIENGIEVSKDKNENALGAQSVIRGNSIVSIEALEPIV